MTYRNKAITVEALDERLTAAEDRIDAIREDLSKRKTPKEPAPPLTDGQVTVAGVVGAISGLVVLIMIAVALQNLHDGHVLVAQVAGAIGVAFLTITLVVLYAIWARA